MTLEVERQGTIVLREVVALPQRLANVTSPVKGAAFNGPFRVTWEPLGLAALSLTQPSSNVVGWRSAGGGGLMTMNLGAPAFVDASGQVDVTGSSQVKNLELSFSGRKGQLTLRFRVNVPVN